MTYFNAVGRGDFGQLNDIIAAGIDINRTDNNGNTLLHYAVQYGEEGIVESLLNQGSNINAQNKDGKTPLILAVQSDDLSLTRFLLSQTPDVNQTDNDGYTALDYSVDQPEIFFSLINAGADPRIATKNGETAADLATDKRVKRFLNDAMLAPSKVVDEKTGRTNFMKMARDGKADVLKTYLTLDPDVNQTDLAGNTAAHYAAKAGHYDVIKVLIDEYFADLSLQNQAGQTPLQVAVENDFPLVAILLVEGGSDFPDLTEAQRKNPLWRQLADIPTVDLTTCQNAEDAVTMNRHAARATISIKWPAGTECYNILQLRKSLAVQGEGASGYYEGNPIRYFNIYTSYGVNYIDETAARDLLGTSQRQYEASPDSREVKIGIDDNRVPITKSVYSLVPIIPPKIERRVPASTKGKSPTEIIQVRSDLEPRPALLRKRIIEIRPE